MVGDLGVGGQSEGKGVLLPNPKEAIPKAKRNILIWN